MTCICEWIVTQEDTYNGSTLRWQILKSFKNINSTSAISKNDALCIPGVKNHISSLPKNRKRKRRGGSKQGYQFAMSKRLERVLKFFLLSTSFIYSDIIATINSPFNSIPNTKMMKSKWHIVFPTPILNLLTISKISDESTLVNLFLCQNKVF